MTGTFPPNTPSLPYRCGDPTCPCSTTSTTENSTPTEGKDSAPPTHEGPTPTGELFVQQQPAGWSGRIFGGPRAWWLDEFHARTLGELLETVHRNYPDVAFNPEGD